MGAWAALTETVTREKTVAHFHDDMPEVYGTPFMIYLMELAAASAIRPYLPPGWISVGAGIDVRHRAATPTGFTITARAEVLEWDGKAVTFAVEAKDEIIKILGEAIPQLQNTMASMSQGCSGGPNGVPPLNWSGRQAPGNEAVKTLGDARTALAAAQTLDDVANPDYARRVRIQ